MSKKKRQRKRIKEIDNAMHVRAPHEVDFIIY